MIKILFRKFNRFIEEANFNWPAYLLGDEYNQPIISIDPHDDSINDNDDKIDLTFDTSKEIDIELKPIDVIEQEN